MVNSRTKGHGFEREIANLLKEVFPNAKRHLEYQFQEATGIDLDGTDNWDFQCKRGRRYASTNKILEIKSDRHIRKHALISKADQSPIMVTMYFDDFIQLLKDQI